MFFSLENSCPVRAFVGVPPPHLTGRLFGGAACLQITRLCNDQGTEIPVWELNRWWSGILPLLSVDWEKEFPTVIGSMVAWISLSPQLINTHDIYIYIHIYHDISPNSRCSYPIYPFPTIFLPHHGPGKIPSPAQDALRFRSLPEPDPLSLAACADKPGQRIRRADVKSDGTRLGHGRINSNGVDTMVD